MHQKSLHDYDGFGMQDAEKSMPWLCGEVECFLYCYFYVATSTACYVGVTTRSVKGRDKEHLRDCKTSFDKQYTPWTKQQFDLKVLETKVFRDEGKRGSDWVRDVLAKAVHWLNEKEKACICALKTRDRNLNPRGCNMAEGGGFTVDREVKLRKRTYRNFKDTYIPSLEKIREKALTERRDAGVSEDVVIPVYSDDENMEHLARLIAEERIRIPSPFKGKLSNQVCTLLIYFLFY